MPSSAGSAVSWSRSAAASSVGTRPDPPRAAECGLAALKQLEGDGDLEDAPHPLSAGLRGRRAGERCATGPGGARKRPLLRRTWSAEAAPVSAGTQFAALRARFNDY